MAILQVKSQGFPNLISDLGVQSPLQGPFWGLETITRPVYIVGASKPVPQTATPYPLQNFDYNLNVNPLAGTELAKTVALTRGRYNLEITYWFSNGGVSSNSRLLIHFSDALGGTIQFWDFDFISGTGSSRPDAMGRFEISAENAVENGFFSIQNSTQLTNADIGMTIRWLRTGDLANF